MGACALEVRADAILSLPTSSPSGRGGIAVVFPGSSEGAQGVKSRGSSCHEQEWQSPRAPRAVAIAGHCSDHHQCWDVTVSAGCESLRTLEMTGQLGCWRQAVAKRLSWEQQGVCLLWLAKPRGAQHLPHLALPEKTASRERRLSGHTAVTKGSLESGLWLGSQHLPGMLRLWEPLDPGREGRAWAWGPAQQCCGKSLQESHGAASELSGTASSRWHFPCHLTLDEMHGPLYE